MKQGFNWVQRIQRRRGLLFGLALTAALTAAYTVLCVAGGDGIYPRVASMGCPLGGLDRNQAEAALARWTEEHPPERDRGVVFRAVGKEGRTLTVRIPRAWTRIDLAATADRAWSLGRELPFPLRGGVLLRCLLRKTEVPPVCVSLPALNRQLERTDRTVGRPIVPSSWSADGAKLTLTRGRPGLLLDRTALEETVLTRMARGDLHDLSGEPQFTAVLQTSAPAELNLKAVCRQVERPARDAVFSPGEKRFQTEAAGVRVDREAAERVWKSLDWGESGVVPLTVLPPKTTLAELEPRLYRDVLGECATSIAGSENRVRNVTLAAGAFNGTVLMPGEIFSYNGVVGQRTAQRGFLPAPVYVSGRTVQEIGGGVCQGSSTLYLAALRANLEIRERYPHGFLTRYVPDGMDATVYYGVKDLKIRNDTPFPVKLAARVEDRILTVRVLGTKCDGITVEMTSRVTDRRPYRTVYQVDRRLAGGETRTAVAPYTGYTVEVYRNLYENGTLLESRLESVNVYRSRDRVVLVSPADARRYGAG